MRITRASIAMLLALPGPAALAQTYDPDLVDCLALSYIALSQAEADLPTAPDTRVAELVSMLESVSAGLSHIVAEQTECTGTLEDMIGVVQASRDEIVSAFQTHVATSEDAVASYGEVIFAPLRTCMNEVGRDRIEAANADRLTNGYACGWGL